MTDASYAWIYEDPFHFYFSICTTTLSICSNGLLLFVLYTTRIGPYSYLLAVFSVCDLLTTCAHATFRPILHMTYGGFYFFPRHGKIMIAGKPFDSIFALIFIATYYQTFLVLAFHFVYRYKIVSRGMDVSCTNKWKRKHWAVLGVLINILYISGLVLLAARFMPTEETREIVPMEIEEIYGIDLRDANRGFTRPDLVIGRLQLHYPSIIVISGMLGMFLGTAIVIIYCMWQTNIIINCENETDTILFKSLLIQTAIPVVFSYAPLSIMLLFPAVTGISLGAFGNVLFTITSVFPSIDAFFVLFFIRVLRIAVVRLFRITIYVNDASMADATTDFKTVKSDS